MDYVQQLKRENEIRQKIEKWSQKRKDLIYQVNDFYNTKGQKFVKDLERLLTKYENTPKYNATEIINQLTKKI